ncbi:MAG: hypothetical protein AAGA76_15610, partial [Pseudomonadota bacterium]
FQCFRERSSRQNAMVDPQGVSPNQFDDLFAELENWEAVLRALPDFDVDQGPEEDDPPDVSPS